MGYSTRLSNVALGSLITLGLLIGVSISQMHPGNGHPPQHHPGNGLPPQHHPGNGLPPQHHPGNGLPPQHHPGNGLPPQQHPGNGLPPQQHPGHGLPPQQHPGQGHPQQHPGQGHPPQDFPQQEFPQQEFPQQQFQQPPQQQQFQQQQFPQQQQYQQHVPQQQQAPPTPIPSPFPTPTELKIEVVSRPKKCARLSKKSDLLTIHYIGKLAATNVVFDNSRKHPEPLKFQLGAAAVIRAWEEGLKNMCVGEIRKLIVPPHMGYGDRVIERIPAKSTLLFEIELMNIEDGEKIPNVFRLIDINGDQLLSRDEVKSYIDSEAARLGMQKDADNSMLAEIFKQEDKNLDGLISHDEFSGPKHDEL